MSSAGGAKEFPPGSRPVVRAPLGPSGPSTAGSQSVRGVDLGHRFAGTDWLFRGLDFELEPGLITGVCGPSGCGKSTLLWLLAGWEKPCQGRVERVGVERIGWVFQNPHGVARRTALDHVAFPLLARGLSRSRAEAEAEALMAGFGLAELAERPFAALSGGEAQRLMLARATAAAPDLLLVDEPTAQLDARTALTVSTCLGQIAASGAVVVIATHDPAVRAACHRVIDLGAVESDTDQAQRSDPAPSPDLAARPESSAWPDSSARPVLGRPSERWSELLDGPRPDRRIGPGTGP
ncbi:MAG: energy-coupling factor ABC transporter ATP-binding protein [Propionibacteriaceae bacterium]|nr:energy-coupling factor ABC transporter ATP-binding protein [Propionibacteriaceae bacterium]